HLRRRRRDGGGADRAARADPALLRFHALELVRQRCAEHQHAEQPERGVADAERELWWRRIAERVGEPVVRRRPEKAGLGPAFSFFPGGSRLEACASESRSFRRTTPSP